MGGIASGVLDGKFQTGMDLLNVVEDQAHKPVGAITPYLKHAGIYAHIDDKRIAQLAAAQAHSRPGMTTQGFGPKKFANTTIHRKLSRSGERAYPHERSSSSDA
jgi:hypothetical protein